MQQKRVVRKIRDDDPKHIRDYRDYGMPWLVFRSPEQQEGKAFHSWHSAVFWAHRDFVWLSS